MQQIRISIGDGNNFVQRILTIPDGGDAEALINQLLDSEIDETWGDHILVQQSQCPDSDKTGT